MRWFLTLLVWLVSVAVLTPVCFFGVIFLAGPHSSVLPDAMQSVALLLGFAIWLLAPVWLARKVWNRAGGRGR